MNSEKTYFCRVSYCKETSTSTTKKDPESPTENTFVKPNLDFSYKKKTVIHYWKMLRKFNNRLRKNICKQQKIKSDINFLQKNILEIKQHIIDLNK